jgi:signal transduction histidine kinase
MSYHWIVPLLAAIASLVLGVVVYRSADESPVRRLFAVLALMLVFWNLHAFVLFYVKDIHLAFVLSKVFRSGSLLVVPAITHLTLLLKDRPPRWGKAVVAVNYGVGIGLIVANTFDLLVAKLEPSRWGYQSVGGPLYHLFTALVLADFPLAIGFLTHEYRTTSSPQRRQQLRFWLLGALVALPLGITQMLPAYGIPFYPLGNLGNAAWAAIVAYAIVRHRLMDVDIVVTKGMAYGTVLFVLIAPAFGVTLWVQRLSFGHIHPDFSFLVLVMLVAVGALFPTLRFRAEVRIHRSLFGEKHEYRAALSAFARSIVRILDRERLMQQLTTALVENLGLNQITVALFDESKQRFILQHTLGPIANDQFPREHPFIDVLARCQDAVLVDELEAASSSAERAVVVETCRRNAWQVCIPLATAGRLIGFISLGRKGNRDAFFAEDLELLGMLAAETTIALENARLYEELKKSQDIIRRADRLSALGTLAAGIAHEIRNPLVSIQTFFQLAPDRLHDEEFFTGFLGMTANEVKRISDLITELLTFARSPTRTLGPLDINQAVERVVPLLEPEARKHNLRLIRELSPTPPVVLADADQIKQVLINLILNAIQATQPGGLVSVITRIVDRQGMLSGQLEVSDTGPGISKEQLEHIFDPFFTTKDKGTGLGLSIAHQIAVEHGGSISVESEVGHGTTFVVSLPAAQMHEVPPDQSIASSTAVSRYSRPRKLAAS